MPFDPLTWGRMCSVIGWRPAQVRLELHRGLLKPFLSLSNEGLFNSSPAGRLSNPPKAVACWLVGLRDLGGCQAILGQMGWSFLFSVSPIFLTIVCGGGGHSPWGRSVRGGVLAIPHIQDLHGWALWLKCGAGKKALHEVGPSQ